jgi:hypothetical protein
MMKYLDTKLVVDSSYTINTLGWEPSSRNDLKRRLLFLIENMKNHSIEWNVRNETQMIRTANRFNIQAYDLMLKNRELVINKMFDYINLKDNVDYFPNYQKMDTMVLKWYITMLYQLIATSIKVGDRILVRKYIQAVAFRRFKEGFSVSEPVDFLTNFEHIILSELNIDPNAKEIRNLLFSSVSISIQMCIDEMEESFEVFESQSDDMTKITDTGVNFQNVGNLKQIISNLEDTFFGSMEQDLSQDLSVIKEQI